MDLCHEIESIDCELAIYRKGFLNIRLDLIKGLIVWKDSNHWSNNFVRSMTFSEVEVIRRLLPELCAGGEKNCSCPLPATGSDNVRTYSTADGLPSVGCSWQITVHRQDDFWCIRGTSQKTVIWKKVKNTIEQISRIPVRVQ